MAIVDQREIQMRGGRCHRSPVSCVVHDLFTRAGLDPRKLIVFDVTYGEGRFWYYSKPRILIGADIAIYEWIVDPDLFIKKPAWASWRVLYRMGISVDAIVVDPPWVRNGSSKRTMFGVYNALGSPRIIIDSALVAANNLSADYVLVHYKYRIDANDYEILEETWFKPVTRYNNYPHSNDKTWFGLLRRKNI